MASSAAASAPFTPTTKAVHKAAKGGDRQTLAACIACKDIDLNATVGWFKQSPLHAAVRNGHLQCVQDLLDAGADVQVYDKYGNTPLQTAATRKDTACLKALAAAGALAGSGYFRKGETALHTAAKQGHLAGVQALLRCEDAVNAQRTIEVGTDSDGLPLHAAARGGHSECFMALLEADKSLINTTVCGGKHQYLHRHTATSGGHSECSLGLPEGDARCCQCIAELQTPLQLAAAHCSLEAVKAGLAAGGRVDVTNEHGEGPTFAAAAGGNKDVLALLLQHTPDSVHQRNAFGTRPLHIAAENGHTACVELLLEAGAEVVAVQDGSGNTALHLAAMGGHADCVSLLLAAHSGDRGELVSLCNASGDSALPMAARRGHKQCVASLLEVSAASRWAGVVVAARHGHAGCLELLLQGWGDPPHDSGATALHWAVQNGHMACVKLLLAHKSSLVDALDADGWLPLFTAVAAERLELLELLVGGSRQAVGGVTALHLAVACRSPRYVERLLELDPTLLDARTDAGNTALHFAVVAKLEVAKSQWFREYTTPWAVSLRDKDLGKGGGLRATAANLEVAKRQCLGEYTTPRAVSLRDKDLGRGDRLHATATTDVFVRSPLSRRLDTAMDVKRRTMPDTKLACLRMLLARGASVDALNSSGDTPLHCAVARGTPAAVSALLAAQARADLLNAAGTGMLHIAVCWQMSNDTSWLTTEGQEVHLAAGTTREAHEVLAIVRGLLDAGADPNAVVPGHGTPLYMVLTNSTLTWSERWECVLRLLAAGADPNAVVPGHGTLLNFVLTNSTLTWSERWECVLRLLDAGADPNAVVPGLGTPLYMAITSTTLAWSGRLEYVSRLLAAGADATVSGAGHGERSALDGAIRLRKPQLVKALAASCRQFTLDPSLQLATLGDTQQGVDTLNHLQLESRWRRRRPLALIREQRRAVRDAGLVHKEWEKREQEEKAARSKRKKQGGASGDGV